MLSNSIVTLRGVKSGLRHMAGGKRALNLSFCVLFSQAAAEKSVSSRGGSPGRKGGAGGGQEAFLSDERRRYLLQRTAFRTAWVGLTLIIAVEIPDFLGFMGLIGSACVGMVVFILPRCLRLEAATGPSEKRIQSRVLVCAARTLKRLLQAR